MPDSVRRTVTRPFLSFIIAADPEWSKNSKEVVEYEMSNGKQFTGRTEDRGPYADD